MELIQLIFFEPSVYLHFGLRFVAEVKLKLLIVMGNVENLYFPYWF